MCLEPRGSPRHPQTLTGLCGCPCVSAYQIATPDFIDTVKDALDRHSVPPEAITLEITEAVALTNMKGAIVALTELRRHGVRVALDDFGVGYSSLRYLHELPIDVIKIDRSFVMGQGSETDALLQAMVVLGQSLGLEIVAEGIETPSELERLRRFEGIAGQGFLFARPMPAANARQFGRNQSITATHPQPSITRPTSVPT